MVVTRGRKWEDFTVLTSDDITDDNWLVGLDQSGAHDRNFRISFSELDERFGGASAENVISVEDSGNAATNGTALLAARDAAVSGDLIHVHPGTYTLPLDNHNLAKNGVHYHFEAGVTVQVDDTSTGVAQADRTTGFFDDSAIGHGTGADLVCRVTGHAKFRFHIGAVSVVTGPALFRLTRANSEMRVECDEVVLDDSDGSAYYSAFSVEGGKFFLRCNKASRTKSTTLFWYKNGTVYAEIDEITSYDPVLSAVLAAIRVAVTDTPTGHFHLKARDIHGSLIVYPPLGSNHANAVAWVECDRVRGMVHQKGTQFYLQCRHFIGQPTDDTQCIVQESGKSWVEIDRFTAEVEGTIGAGTNLGYAYLDGESHWKVKQFEDLAISDSYLGGVAKPAWRGAIAVAGGTHYLECEELSVTTPLQDFTQANSAVVKVEGGTLHFRGRITSTDPLCHGFDISGGTLVLYDTQVDLNGALNALRATSSQTVTLNGTLNITGTATINSNITLAGPSSFPPSIFYGTQIVRQQGGVVGTDEGWIYHDGTNLRIENKSSSQSIIFNEGITTASNKDIVSGSGGSFNTGTAFRATAFGAFYGVLAGTRLVVQNGTWEQYDDWTSPANTPAQITADTNNYAPGRGTYQRWSSDASRNVTGMTQGVNGAVREVWNVGAQNIVLVNESASSTAANRFTTSTGANLTLAANKCALFRYDSTTSRWRVVLLP